MSDDTNEVNPTAGEVIAPVEPTPETPVVPEATPETAPEPTPENEPTV